MQPTSGSRIPRTVRGGRCSSTRMRRVPHGGSRRSWPLPRVVPSTTGSRSSTQASWAGCAWDGDGLWRPTRQLGRWLRDSSGRVSCRAGLQSEVERLTSRRSPFRAGRVGGEYGPWEAARRCDPRTMRGTFWPRPSMTSVLSGRPGRDETAGHSCRSGTRAAGIAGNMHAWGSEATLRSICRLIRRWPRPSRRGATLAIGRRPWTISGDTSTSATKRCRLVAMSSRRRVRVRSRERRGRARGEGRHEHHRRIADVVRACRGLAARGHPGGREALRELVDPALRDLVDDLEPCDDEASWREIPTTHFGSSIGADHGVSTRARFVRPARRDLWAISKPSLGMTTIAHAHRRGRPRPFRPDAAARDSRETAGCGLVRGSRRLDPVGEAPPDRELLHAGTATHPRGRQVRDRRRWPRRPPRR